LEHRAAGLEPGAMEAECWIDEDTRSQVNVEDLWEG